jgi:hypothetical protein
MTPGVLAQSVMFVAIFYGIAVVWERNLGKETTYFAMSDVQSRQRYGYSNDVL